MEVAARLGTRGKENSSPRIARSPAESTKISSSKIGMSILHDFAQVHLPRRLPVVLLLLPASSAAKSCVRYKAHCAEKVDW